jgi:hypothetical protein
MSLAMHQQLLILITVVVRLQNENNVIIHNHICFVFHSLSMKGKTKITTMSEHFNVKFASRLKLQTWLNALSRISVLRLSILPLSMILLLDF